MPKVIREEGPIRYLSDGTVEIDEDTYQALAALGLIEGQLEGDDNDDNSDISGDDSDDVAETLSVLGDIIGAKKNKDKKKQNALFQLLSRLGKKNSNKQNTSAGKTVTLDPKQVATQMAKNSLQPGFLDGTNTTNAAGDVEVTIRPQHDFHADDVTFNGSTAGTRVKSIWFGDRNIFSSVAGIDVSVFAANNTMRGLLKGSFIRGGLDIRLTFALTGAGTASVTFTGKRPLSSC